MDPNRPSQNPPHADSLPLLEPDRLYPSAVTAMRLGISDRSLRRLRSAGKITAVRIGGAIRFRGRDIQRAIEQGVA
ncbi:MAG: helix-turn-helix domain-containing protein [Phycisphaerales bacterium]|nr:helix-turn-helix domain-containing protein [Phycisphaerales bacterium]